MTRFSIRYHRAAELVADHDGQLLKGGLLLRVEPPAGLALFAPASLVVTWSGQRVELTGQVVQIVAGVGVAVAVDPAPLAEMVAAARVAGASADGGAAEHVVGDLEEEAAADGDLDLALEPEEETEPTRPVETYQRVRDADTSARRQMALKGNKDERALIMRDTNKALHAFLLQNPGLGLDEVAAMARMPGMSADALKGIAANRKWSQRPDIALALVRNPSTPVPTAVALVPVLKQEDMRILSKTTGVKLPVIQAIRRRLL